MRVCSESICDGKQERGVCEISAGIMGKVQRDSSNDASASIARRDSMRNELVNADTLIRTPSGSRRRNRFAVINSIFLHGFIES